ncbi:protein-serine/threonine phosphatase [Leclercia adecarboxylata]|uniref:protein-serine/threonine phosphatase n=1 Tax=Leclercia adecarboxylata TaxID=83655 RepID=UPI00202AC05A|nr:protein-serine/threonine phosphatase [Leclercia adecarboxylata]URN97717.1 protein-serine/threonine phosphatase [Leclercia adecarboxylata]
MYLKLDGHNWRHVWVVSDLHGCYQMLIKALRHRHFNPYEDLLISVGDVIDRGPDSVKCLQLVNEAWFYAVRGNHEQMALDALHNNQFGLWMMNGGDWFAELKGEQQQQAIGLFRRCETLPWIIEINCANGINVIAHADYPSSRYVRDKPVEKQPILWNRDRLQAVMNGSEKGIDGADHFWFGHTPLRERYDCQNLHYIDTGAVFGGTLTLAQLQ